MCRRVGGHANSRFERWSRADLFKSYKLGWKREKVKATFLEATERGEVLQVGEITQTVGDSTQSKRV